MKYKNYDLVGTKYDLKGDGFGFYDIPYKNLSPKNKLDLFIPSVNKDKYPIVIFIHGGGFMASDKSHHLSSVLNFLQDGYAVASLNYRLNDEMVFPQNFNDCIDALDFLGRKSKELKIDNQKMVLWGETHGAFLASAIGILNHISNLYKILGVISFYAPIDLYDFHIRQIKDGKLMMTGNELADEKTFGAKGQELLNVLKKYDLLNKIDGSEPPFYLLHGDKDNFIPLEYSYKFSRILTEHKVPNVLDIVKNGTHGIDFYAKSKYNFPIRNFVRRIFNNEINQFDQK